MKRATPLIALLLTAFVLASTQSAPSDEVREKITWHPAKFPIFSPKKAWTKPNVMVTSLRFDGLIIDLEQTDIRETAKRYQAELGREGDAGDFFQWLCSSEIDGDRIGEFSIKPIGSNADVDSRCKPLSSDSDDPSTSPSKIRVGMSESDLMLVLGEPTARRDNFLYYAHSHDLKLHDEPYTLMNTVIVEVKDGVVT